MNNTKKIKLWAGTGILSAAILINGLSISINQSKNKEGKFINIPDSPLAYQIEENRNLSTRIKEIQKNIKTGFYTVDDMPVVVGNILQDDQFADTIKAHREVTKMPKELSIAEKIEIIKETEKLSDTQWHEFVCTCIAESKPGDYAYEETANVVTSVINRKISRTWVDYINKVVGNNAGNNLYGQITAPSQYTAFGSNGFWTLMELSDEELYAMPNFQGLVDTLYAFDTEEDYVPIHNYVGYRANGTNPTGKVQLVPGGNLYCYPIDDYIPVEERETYAYNNGLGRY